MMQWAQSEASVEGMHERIATLGDEREAVVERETGEPLQYVASTSMRKQLVARWDAVIEAAVQRARRR